jgi:uncharacterized protein YkwD
MRSASFIFMLLFATAMFSSAPRVQAQSPKEVSYRDVSVEILHLINEHRREKGLAPLVINEEITKAALSHSRNMAMKKVPFGHDKFDERMRAVGRKVPSMGWAENVAAGQTTAQGVVRSWLNSKGHRENIEGRYDLTGIGIAMGKDGQLYYTQIFVKKKK